MFKDKIQERFEVNREALNSAIELFQSMLGNTKSNIGAGSSQLAINAIQQYFKIDDSFLSKDLNSKEEIKRFLKLQGLFCHHIKLEGKWWKNATGPIITSDASNNLVALIPSSSFGYQIVDPETGRKRRLNAKSFEGLSTDGLNFFHFMSRGKLSTKEFLKYAVRSVPTVNYILVIIVCAIATLLSLLVPIANKIMFSEVVPSGLMNGILPICGLLLGAGISSVLFTIVRNIVIAMVRDKMNANVQPALFVRLLTLPSSFFRKHSSSDLSSRVLAANNIYLLMTNQLLGLMAASIFAVLYFLIAFMYAKNMIALVTIIFTLYIVIYAILIRKYSTEFADKVPNAVKTHDFTYGAITGIHKIKNNRAELRAYSQWAERYYKSEEITAETSFMLRYGKIFGCAIYSFGNLFVWITAWRSNMAVSDFVAFMSAFGVMQTTLFTLRTQLQNIAQIFPYINLLEPILETEPELNSNSIPVSNISGEIDINHVSFRYDDKSPMILDDVSLHIPAGQNVGLVGASGCGKSSLMRIMLGFEKPITGSVFYGPYNLENVNMGSLRQYIGYCPQFLQVFPGTISENIRLAAPMASDEEVWEAARIASLDEDIRKMPLQMETTLGEGGSGLSGGQCQRLLIARAIINRPKILFFDEATSALDNITQKNVINNLSEFGCTRISIAHRLSTIMECDRVIVLDKGKIIEDGKPSELLTQKGFFYKLAQRQQL